VFFKEKIVLCLGNQTNSTLKHYRKNESINVKGSVTYGYLCRKRDWTSGVCLEQRIDLSQDLCLEKAKYRKSACGIRSHDPNILVFLEIVVTGSCGFQRSF
jgi:hypothetical protein